MAPRYSHAKDTTERVNFALRSSHLERVTILAEELGTSKTKVIQSAVALGLDALENAERD